MAPSKHHFASNRSGSRTLKSGPRSEDIQPNESINKRQRLPPTVNSVTQNQRARWVGRRPNRFPVTHQKTHSILHEPSGSMRGPPSSTLATLAVPYAQPHCPASTGDTSCQNTAQSVNDIESRQSRLGHTASTPSLPTSESPAPKRRKLEGSPSVEVRDKISTGTIASNFPFSVSSASSETLVSDPRVKVERSDSPELHSKPQLNTSGSKRYAPIPPECRKSHPNHMEARSAWVRKEQEALMRLGLRVVRTFIREDGMVIDWEAIDVVPTDTANVIERALLLNDAAMRDPPVLSSSPLTSTSKRLQIVGGNEYVPSAVEIVPRNPSMDRRCQSQTQVTQINTGDGNLVAVANVHVHTPAPIACFPEGGCFRHTVPTAALPPLSPSHCCSHICSPMRDRPTIDGLLHSAASCQMPIQASICQPAHLLHGPSTSPGPPSPPPSQHALDALHHILQLKRQISRSSSSTGPPATSPSPSYPMRKLYPVPKEPKSPSRQPAESSADAVAAAINESARLIKGGSGRAPALGTPLRVYQKRRSAPATPVRVNGKHAAPRSEPGHRGRRDSISPERHSSPPIVVLGLTRSSTRSPPLGFSRGVSSDELDELDLSYPPSSPSTEVRTEPPRPVETTEPVREPSLLSPIQPSPEENAAMRTAALQYLERYWQTFDMDRRTLAEAYAPNAAFSCTSRNLRTQGRDGVLNALTMLGDGVLCSGRNVAYDVSYPGPDIGVLLVVLGTMFRAEDNRSKEVGYTMSFVLQPGIHEDRVNGRDTGQWPLKAILHQVVLREPEST